MKLKLIRNPETLRDKEQEDAFEKTMNTSLYFFMNKKISKIDSWNIFNIKKLIKNLDEKTEIIIEFSKWNKNVELLFEQTNSQLGEIEELSKENKNIFIEKNIIEIHNYIKEIADDKNKKMQLLLFLVELVSDERITNLTNLVLNKGISTIDFALESTIPILLMEKKNE